MKSETNVRNKRVKATHGKKLPTFILLQERKPHHMINATTKRIKLTRNQSLAKFGNPYGDDANMMLVALNAAWKARRALTLVYGPQILPQIDPDMKDLVAYLEEHKHARPYQFDELNGYQYSDLSYCNWEGRWQNL